ncbi:hypothetical protein [Halorussus sp. AFM4]|uniref:hypothetical protein n=1 Tax=Halorussus sp. AFM4 TaxID=3421651 RepID=UPI003EBDB8B0
MSTDTPQRAHDPDADPGTDADSRSRDEDEGVPPSDDVDPDDDLVVAVYPRRVHEQVRDELGGRRERPCREYEAEYADLLAERARLVEEVAALERQLDRAESRLDAVVEQYERILAARDDSGPERLAGTAGDAAADRDAAEDPDDEPTGRRREVDRRKADLAVRLRNWLR